MPSSEKNIYGPAVQCAGAPYNNMGQQCAGEPRQPDKVELINTTCSPPLPATVPVSVPKKTQTLSLAVLTDF